MPCLSHHEVSQFLLGTLPADIADQSEQHFLSCDRCLISAENVRPQDGLVTALGADDDTAVDDDDRSVVLQLMDRLGSLANEGQAAPLAADELQQILEAPQSEGEIGRLAHFRILEVLGAGGMGIVFKAEDAELQRIVALKVMRPSLASNLQAKRRFRREAQAAAAFEHENIVTIYQVEEDRGVPFFSMQWLEGESLRDRLRRAGKLPLGEALKIAREVATGLAAAHARGLLHRDIKPDNIWLNKTCQEFFPPADADLEKDSEKYSLGASYLLKAENVVKIVDFGLVCSLEEPSSLTHSGMILGTPQYMAPEQACGEEVDGRSDLFSVGCVLYHMLTGRPAFDAPNVVATLVAVSKAEVTPPHEVDPTVPRRVSDVTMRLLAREPARRFPSATELARELAQIESDLPKLQVEPSRSPLGTRLFAAICAAGLVALLLGIIAIETNKGTLIVDADDEVAVLVRGDAVELHDRETGKKYDLNVGENRVRPGEYEIVAREAASGLEFSARRFAIHRGDSKRVEVRLVETSRDIREAHVDAAGGVSRPGTSHLDLAGSTRPPNWLGDVEDSLGILPGEPLSPLTLVQKPRRLESAISWTIESAVHRGAVNHAAFSPDGSRIATAGDDGTVRIFSVNRPADSPNQIIICPGQVRGLAWSHNGSLLATAQKDPENSICIWQLPGGESPRNVNASDSTRIMGLESAATDRELDERQVAIKLIAKINRKTNRLAWSPDDRHLAFNDNGVQLWDMGSNEVLPNFGMTGSIGRRPWSSDGRYLASRDAQTGAIHVWNVANRSLHATVGDSYGDAPIFSKEGMFLAALHFPDSGLDQDGRRITTMRSVHIWDLDRNQRVKDIQLAQSPIYGIAWSPDGARLAALGEREATMWDVKTGRQLALDGFGPELYVSPAREIGDWSHDGRSLLAVHFGRAVLWEGETGQWRLLAGPSTEIVTDQQGDSLAVWHFRAGTPLASGFLPSRIELWSLSRQVRTAAYSGDGVLNMALSPDGERLALVSGQSFRENSGQEIDDRLTLSVYDTEQGTLLAQGEFQANPALGVNWSPTGEMLILYQLPGAIHVVQAQSCQLLHTITGPLEAANSSVLSGYPSFRSGPMQSSLSAVWLPNGAEFAWRGDSTGIAITDAATGSTTRVLDCLTEELRLRAQRRQEQAEQLEQSFGSRGRGGRSMLDAVRVHSITVSPDGRWIACYRATDSRRFGSREVSHNAILLWDLARSENTPTWELADSYAGDVGQIYLGKILWFSPDSSRIARRKGNEIQCWATESGELLVAREISHLKEVLGWLPDGKHMAMYLKADGGLPQVALQRLGEVEQDLVTRTLIAENCSVAIRGDQILTTANNVMQSFDASLDLQSSRIFSVSDNLVDILQVGTGGAVARSDNASSPSMVVLTQQGQATLSWEEFQTRYGSTTTEGD